MGQDSVVGIVTHNQLDVQGSHASTFPGRPLGFNQPPTQWLPGLFPGVKWPGCAVDHTASFSAEVKERVEL